MFLVPLGFSKAITEGCADRTTSRGTECTPKTTSFRVNTVLHDSIGKICSFPDATSEEHFTIQGKVNHCRLYITTMKEGKPSRNLCCLRASQNGKYKVCDIIYTCISCFLGYQLIYSWYVNIKNDLLSFLS